MKELTIEQKAQRYDEAIEKAKGVIEQNPLMEYLKKGIEYILPELKEDKDEEIRKGIIRNLEYLMDRAEGFVKDELKERITWLEKQGEHAKFRDSIQVGDKVTRNKDGVLVNLSQLNRVAKKDEKQDKNDMGISEDTKQKLEDKLNKALKKETPESCNEFLEKQGWQKPAVIIPKFRIGDEIKTTNEEPLTITKIDEKGYWSEDLFICGFDEECIWDLVGQKPAENVEPKFHEGDWIVDNCGYVWKIEGILNQFYILEDGEGGESHPTIGWVNKTFHLWTIQDAKDGDVLVMQKTDVTYESIFIFKKIENDCIIQYLHYFITDAGEKVCEARSIDGFLGFVGTTVHPSTKEQRDTLEKAMTDAGYEWSDKDRKLIKIVK